MTTTRVHLGPRSYPIVAGDGALRSLPRLWRTAGLPPRAHIVTDRRVARLHLDALVQALGRAGIEPSVTILSVCSVSTTALDFGVVANVKLNQRIRDLEHVEAASVDRLDLPLGQDSQWLEVPDEDARRHDWGSPRLPGDQLGGRRHRLRRDGVPAAGRGLAGLAAPAGTGG